MWILLVTSSILQNDINNTLKILLSLAFYEDFSFPLLNISGVLCRDMSAYVPGKMMSAGLHFQHFFQIFLKF